MSQYKVGTATFTNGSSTVTGVDTLWSANVSAGDYIVRVGDNVSYEVASVVSNTSLTLTSPYGGVTGSGLSYVVHIDFHPNGAPKWTNGDVEFAAIQNRWNSGLPNLPLGSASTESTATLLARANHTGTQTLSTISDAGTAASLDTGTAPTEVPTNADLGTAAILDSGTAAGEVPTNGDLGTASLLDTGTADAELPTNADVKTKFNATGVAPLYACRAWVNFNGTGTVAIRDSGNVSSITDNGTGDYTVNFTNAIEDENYSAVMSSGSSATNASEGGGVHTYTVSSCRIRARDAANTIQDEFYVSIAIFR